MPTAKRITATPATKKDPAPDTNGRPVVYPEVKVILCTGAKALTIDKMKSFLGWTADKEVAKKHGFTEPLFRASDGQDVWCLNNAHNRSFDSVRARMYGQDRLNDRWRFNGETIIIGDRGSVLSAQHRLVGWVDAEIMRLKEPERWARTCPNPVTVECIVVQGVSEDQETIRTLDNVKPRSPADVLYTSGLFDLKKYTRADQNKLCRMAQFAIQLLWKRTGEGLKGSLTPDLTNSEVVDYLKYHPHLVRAVKHIHEENADDKIAKYLSPGYASALLYMMGCSASDGEKYRDHWPHDESTLSWGNWDKAQEFWVLLAGTAKETVSLRMARRPGVYADADEISGFIFAKSEDGGSTKERMAAVIRGWLQFVEHGKTKGDVLSDGDYKIDENNVRQLAVCPDCGGIDLGTPKDRPAPEPWDKPEDAPENGAESEEEETITEPVVEKKPNGKHKAQAKTAAEKIAEIRARKEAAQAAIKAQDAVEDNGEVDPNWKAPAVYDGTSPASRAAARAKKSTAKK